MMILRVLLSILPAISLASLDPIGSALDISPGLHNPKDESIHQDIVTPSFIGTDSILETHSISAHGYRKSKRSPNYHVLESPGLKTYFKIDPVERAQSDKEGTGFWKKIGKRSIDDSEVNDMNPRVQPEIEGVGSWRKIDKRSAANSELDDMEPRSEKYTQFEESKTDAISEPDQTPREARGATKEQWIKQPYPVQFSKKSSSDNDQHASSSNNDDINVRAPRVHFVTQKRLETSESRDRNEIVHPVPVSPPRNYDPIPRPAERGRSLDPTFDYRYDPRRRYYDTPAPSVPLPSRDYTIRNLDYAGRSRDYYPRYDDARYSRYDDLDAYGRPQQKKQRRIIYYATLPDTPRTPPNVDLHYRYRYSEPEYNRFDDRFVTSSPVSVSDGDSFTRDRRVDVPPTYATPYYNNRRYYGDDYGKQTYKRRDTTERTATTERISESIRDSQQRGGNNDRKTPYPVKVSTAVNVKDAKPGGPDRRIYSGDRNRDREYLYSPSSYSDDTPYVAGYIDSRF